MQRLREDVDVVRGPPGREPEPESGVGHLEVPPSPRHDDVEQRLGDEVQRASRANALRGVTVTPARMLGRQDIGAIRPGARADLVLLDADPVTVPVERLPKVGVTESWIGGEKVDLG